MKRFASVLLAVVFMLSLSVCSFAVDFSSSPFYLEMVDCIDENAIIPYSLAPGLADGYYYPTSTSSTGWVFGTPTAATLSDNYYVGSSWVKSYSNISSILLDLLVLGLRGSAASNSYEAGYWWMNVIIRITDANGYVLTPADFSQMLCIRYMDQNFSSQPGALGAVSVLEGANCYVFDDGFLQFGALVNSRTSSYLYNSLGFGVTLSSSSAAVAPFSFELEVFDTYTQEASSTVPPFVFGAGAHTTTPDGPRDPNDASQYGDAQDQVQWYNDAYGSAVNPELEDKMSATTDMLLQEQEIEEQMIDGINQYAPAVDPANLSMPTQIVNGIRFIGNTFMGSYNALGDIGFVISFSMMLGVVLVLIGRGEGALARGMASSARERRRTEYASDRDMKKGG